MGPIWFSVGCQCPRSVNPTWSVDITLLIYNHILRLALSYFLESLKWLPLVCECVCVRVRECVFLSVCVCVRVRECVCMCVSVRARSRAELSLVIVTVPLAPPYRPRWLLTLSTSCSSPAQRRGPRGGAGSHPSPRGRGVCVRVLVRELPGTFRLPLVGLIPRPGLRTVSLLLYEGGTSII